MNRDEKRTKNKLRWIDDMTHGHQLNKQKLTTNDNNLNDSPTKS